MLNMLFVVRFPTKKSFLRAFTCTPPIITKKFIPSTRVEVNTGIIKAYSSKKKISPPAADAY